MKEGLIVAQAHIHMSPKDAQALDVANGEHVKVTVGKERPITFNKVLVRVSPNYILDMHIDTDEANSGFITTGQRGTLCRVEA